MVTTKFGGAIAGCHCRVPFRGRVTTKFGEWTWCNSWVVVCYGWGEAWRSGGVDVHCWVPLQGANLCFISSFFFQGHQSHPDNQENNNEFCLELIADVALFSTLITQKLVFAIWGLCWYIFFGGGRGTLILMVEWQELAWCMTFWFFGMSLSYHVAWNPVRFQNRDPLFHWKTTPNCLSKTKKTCLQIPWTFQIHDFKTNILITIL